MSSQPLAPVDFSALTLDSTQQQQPQPTTASTSEAATAPAPSSKPAKPARSARGLKSDDADTRHSKTLSYILRHGAAKESLTLRQDGFVRVADLMKRPKLKGCDMETLERIVRDNAKQRFTMRPEPTGADGESELWIRANQGHSVVVESLELTPVTKAEDVPVVVHGTTSKVWPTIAKEGLKSMTRNHIHCARGLFGEEGVQSGMRKTADVFIYLNLEKILADGVPVFTSSNGVVLTSGVDGVLSPAYFQKVVNKQGEVLL